MEQAYSTADAQASFGGLLRTTEKILGANPRDTYNIAQAGTAACITRNAAKARKYYALSSATEQARLRELCDIMRVTLP